MSIDPLSFKTSLANLLAEAFGMATSPHGFFLDTGQSGLLGTINQLDAATASTPCPADAETIAAHCGHIRWLLTFFAAHERGENAPPDWAASWQVQQVDAAAWASLRQELADTYTYLQDRLQARTDWHAVAVSAWLMLLAHISYHVGVIHKVHSCVQAQVQGSR